LTVLIGSLGRCVHFIIFPGAILGAAAFPRLIMPGGVPPMLELRRRNNYENSALQP
jgi:hypothetical protein